LVAGISIVSAIAYMVIYFKDNLTSTTGDEKNTENPEAFCDIDMNQLLMGTKNSDVEDIKELQRKIQNFKLRNRFYKM
jgi:hypothetical protein